MSFDLKRELAVLVLKYFHDQNLKEAALTLGCESGLFFDMKYFEEMVLKGKWDEAENYLLGFTKVKDNDYSIKIYFEIRKQKYFEALDNNDRYKALDILLKDLKIFAQGNEKLIKDLCHLLVVDNIREIKPTYRDAISARKNLIFEINKIIIQHPLLAGKLKLPDIEIHRLRHLLNQSLKWQKHQRPDQEPDLLRDPDRAAMEWKLLTGRRLSMDSEQRNCNGVLGDVKKVSIEESRNKSKHSFDNGRSSQWQYLQLPKHPEVKRIVKLAYNNSGNSILALASNGIHLVWLWPRTGFNLDGKASVQVCPQLQQPKDGFQVMINDLSTVKCSNPVSCFALSKQGGYVISTSGGMISLFNMVSYKTLRTIMSPPPMVTCLAFYPEDNNIFGIGFDDSSLSIYNVRDDQVLQKLDGHSKRVTTLAFSSTSNVLISADANAQIILWNTNGWKKLKDKRLQIQENHMLESETQIQLHPDQMKFLVVYFGHVAIYETTELRCVNEWVPEIPQLISQATFSSNGHIVYSILVDGTVTIFDATNFEIHCRISTSSYLPPISSLSIYPISIAAHPQKPNQFVVGLTDGSVYVFEPQKPGGDWIKNH
ncbi:Topless-related protein [Vigna angularis]|uniref:Topless-related protein n=1 Tax=Phaseolus angularis TaxID=3914 RepID=A0A8T0JZ80_PHAAN|nr:Topless-related protein [Vigna angularis]